MSTDFAVLDLTPTFLLSSEENSALASALASRLVSAGFPASLRDAAIPTDDTRPLDAVRNAYVRAVLSDVSLPRARARPAFAALVADDDHPAHRPLDELFVIDDAALPLAPHTAGVSPATPQNKKPSAKFSSTGCTPCCRRP